MFGESKRRVATYGCLCLIGLLAAPRENAGADEKKRLPQPTEMFPIVAWYGPPEKETTVERYREMAKAGFTHNLSFLKSVDAAARALDVGRETRIQQIVACPELLGDEVEAAVRRFKEHPATAAYHLRDEPPVKDFSALAERIKRIRAADAAHPCYVNLLPNYGTTGAEGQLGTESYADYIDRFVREVPVPFLSFDHYPIVRGEPDAATGEPVRLRPEWFANLELMRETGRKVEKPLWAFALAVPHSHYPAPTPAHLRLQAFVNLAYGAQAIQYFTYWTPVETDFDFHSAPIGKDGKRTEAYYLAAAMNRQVQALRGVFLGSRVIAVGQTGETLPEGTARYTPATPIRQLTTDGNGAVVSEIVNGVRRYLVIVNCDVLRPMTVAVECDGAASVERVSKDEGELLALFGGRLRAELEPGDVCVLTWPTVKRTP